MEQQEQIQSIIIDIQNLEIAITKLQYDLKNSGIFKRIMNWFKNNICIKQ